MLFSQCDEISCTGRPVTTIPRLLRHSLAFAGLRRIVDHDAGTFKYFIKIVPTEYRPLRGDLFQKPLPSCLLRYQVLGYVGTEFRVSTSEAARGSWQSNSRVQMGPAIHRLLKKVAKLSRIRS